MTPAKSKKRRFYLIIPGIVIVGVLVSIIYALLNGWEALLNYFVDNIIFVTLLAIVLAAVTKYSKRITIRI